LKLLIKIALLALDTASIAVSGA